MIAMSKLQALVQMQVLSTCNAWRYDTRMRVTWSIGLLLALVGGIWGIRSLHQQVLIWQMEGVVQLQNHLWLVLLGGWLGIGMLAVLATLRDGLSEQEASLLFTLPLTSSERFWLLSASILLHGPGIWMVLLASALTAIPGWQLLSWLALCILGSCFISLCCLLCTLLVIYYLWPAPILVRIGAVIGMIAVTTTAVVLSIVRQFVMPDPLLSDLFLLLGLLICLGPGASLCGVLYEKAFYTLQGQLRRSNTRTSLVINWLCVCLGKWRSVTGAMLVKELLYQGRNPWNWLRIPVTLVYLLPFPWCYALIASRGMTRDVFMAVYLAFVVLLNLIDAAPSPFGSEGNRLTLYLTAPLTTRALLRAKLLTYLLPLWCLAIVLGIALGGWLQSAFFTMILVLVQVLLLISGPMILLILGSIWDEDLNIAVEGAAQAFLIEQLPSTPRRLWLIGLMYLLFVTMLVLLWKLPLLLACMLLVGIDLAVLWGLLSFAQYYLHRLFRQG